MVNYDESILVQMADRLYKRASSIIFTLGLFGAFFGGAMGLGVSTSIMLSAGQSDFAGVVLVIGLIGAVMGGIAGALIARERAFMLRLQAQTIMVQVQMERNTRLRLG